MERSQEPVQEKRKEKRKGGTLTVAAAIVGFACLCVLVYAGYRIWQGQKVYREADRSYEEIREIIDDKGPSDEPYKPEDIETIELPDGRFEWEDAYDEGVVWDYEAMRAINPDVIGYIKCRGDGAIVDYPVVRGQDNEFYLDHMFDKSYNHSGALFMDTACADDFDSEYSVIYGHNMASGARMFGYLKQYDNDRSYYAGHSEYDIWTKDKHYVYKVVATYTTYAVSNTYETPLLAPAATMTDEERLYERTRLLDDAIAASVNDTGDQSEAYTDKSNLIALSTCYGGYGSTHRFVVLLKRDREVIPKPETDTLSPVDSLEDTG